jgi:hypothetical protein
MQCTEKEIIRSAQRRSLAQEIDRLNSNHQQIIPVRESGEVRCIFLIRSLMNKVCKESEED